MNDEINIAVDLEFQSLPEHWAPGVMAGLEGYKPAIVSIDLENRKIVLRFDFIIIDDRK